MNIFQRRKFNASMLVYGALALAAATLFGWIISTYTDATIAFAVPTLCLVMLVTRWASPAWLIPAAMFASFFYVTEIYRDVILPPDQVFLTFAALATLTCSFRFLASCHSVSDTVVTPRMNYNSEANTNVASQQQRPSDGPARWLSWGQIVAAWIASVFVCAEFSHMTSDPMIFNRIAASLDVRLGLIPAGYMAIKIFLTLMVLLWICRELLDYLHVRRNVDGVSAMLLRSELWKWNGREQRMISKQLRKNDV